MDFSKERLPLCKVCENRQFDLKNNLLCNLTKEEANFEKTCLDFKPDKEVFKENHPYLKHKDLKRRTQDVVFPYLTQKDKEAKRVDSFEIKEHIFVNICIALFFIASIPFVIMDKLDVNPYYNIISVSLAIMYIFLKKRRTTIVVNNKGIKLNPNNFLYTDILLKLFKTPIETSYEIKWEEIVRYYAYIADNKVMNKPFNRWLIIERFNAPKIKFSIDKFEFEGKDILKKIEQVRLKHLKSKEKINF